MFDSLRSISYYSLLQGSNQPCLCSVLPSLVMSLSLRGFAAFIAVIALYNNNVPAEDFEALFAGVKQVGLGEALIT